MSFLDDILARKRQEVKAAEAELPLGELIASCEGMPATSSLKDALVSGEAPRIISEIKRASPSKGKLREDLDAAATAVSYFNNGAAAISILTDGSGFSGSLEDIRNARNALADVESRANRRIPILRKDFLVSTYQVWQARSAGADAVLLIVAALEKTRLMEMMLEVKTAGMEALVEVHDEAEMETAAETGALVIGINNRNLRTFDVDPATTTRVVPLAPADAVVVVESGIKTATDIQRYMDSGFKAFLIGEALVTSPDPGLKLKECIEKSKGGE